MADSGFIFRYAIPVNVSSADVTLPKACAALMIGSAGNLYVDMAGLKQASAFVTGVNPVTGALTSVALHYQGFGYSATPTATVTNTWGTGATLTATEAGGIVTGLTINDAGTGYGIDPTIIAEGTAQSGTATTITLADDDLNINYNSPLYTGEAINEQYTGYLIKITGGTDSGDIQLITDYNSITKIATVASWSTTPDDTSTYKIYFFKGASNQTVLPQIIFSGGLIVGGTEFTAVPIGLFPISVTKIYHSGTTASGIVALFN